MQDAKYLNGKFFKLYVDGYEKVYVGSTTYPLKSILKYHKHHYNQHVIEKEPTSIILCKYSKYVLFEYAEKII